MRGDCLAPPGETYHVNIMNRIERYFQKSPNYEHYGDFVSIVGAFGWVAVDHEVACTIRSMLDQRRVPAWIEFHDRVGSLIRIRPADIRCLIRVDT